MVDSLPAVLKLIIWFIFLFLIAGVDFNIEATDDVDSGELPVSGFLHEPYPVEAPSEVGPAEPSDIVKQTDSSVAAENQESSAATIPSVNGTAFLTPPTVKKQKRPYVRRSGSKNSEKASSDPVVKLTKLSPRTIARHTNGVSSSQEPTPVVSVLQSPPPPHRSSTPPPHMLEPPELEEAASLVAEEEQLVSVPQPLPQSPAVPVKNGKSRSSGGGPSFLKRNPSKKKVVMPKGVPRSKAKAVAAQKAEAKAAAAANGESSGIRPLPDDEVEPCVECVKCFAVVKVSSARDHLTACSGKPPIPTLPKPVNDENDQRKFESILFVSYFMQLKFFQFLIVFYYYLQQSPHLLPVWCHLVLQRRLQRLALGVVTERELARSGRCSQRMVPMRVDCVALVASAMVLHGICIVTCIISATRVWCVVRCTPVLEPSSNTFKPLTARKTGTVHTILF